MYQVEPCGIAGAVVLKPVVHSDSRGRFVKVFHRDVFGQLGLIPEFVEQYYSVSKRGVLRGMHFQSPPYDHDKMVYCAAGAVLDVIVDIRRGSPTFGKCEVVELSEANAAQIYIPSGCAHGFLAQSDQAIMVYNVTSFYEPEADTGIRWNSFGFDWPVPAPVISERDKGFPPLAGFDSPFHYTPRG